MNAEPCEGRCGCLLSGLGYGGALGMHEWIVSADGQRHALAGEHTARRCRAIRALREAAQAAAGADGQGFVCLDPVDGMFVARACTADGRWDQAYVWPWEATDAPPERLDAFTGRVAALLVERLTHRETDEHPYRNAPIIARNPELARQVAA